jgi:hypothetical protein
LAAELLLRRQEALGIVDREYSRILGLADRKNPTEAGSEFVAVPKFHINTETLQTIKESLRDAFRVMLSPQPFSDVVQSAVVGSSTQDTEDVQIPLCKPKPEDALKNSAVQSLAKKPIHANSTPKVNSIPDAEINIENLEHQLSKLLTGLSSSTYIASNSAPSKPNLAHKSKKPSIRVVEKPVETPSKPDPKHPAELKSTASSSRKDQVQPKSSIAVFPTRKSGTPVKPKHAAESVQSSREKPQPRLREDRLSEHSGRDPAPFQQKEEKVSGSRESGQRKQTPLLKNKSSKPVRASEEDRHVLRLDLTVGATLNMNIQTRDSRRPGVLPTAFTSTKLTSENSLITQGQVVTGFDRLLGGATSPKLSIHLNYNSSSQSQTKQKREDSSSQVSAKKQSDIKMPVTSVRKLKQMADERLSYTSSKPSISSNQHKTYEPLFD